MIFNVPDTFGQFPPSPPLPLHEPPNAPSPHHPSDDELASGIIAYPRDAPTTKRAAKQAEGTNARAVVIEEVKEKGGGNGKGKAKARGKEKENDKKKEKEKEKEKEKGKDKGKGRKDKRGGRTTGSRNFSSEEMAKLVKLVQEELPLGAAGWDKIVSVYNKWAKPETYHERDVKSLRGKFDSIVKTAHEKPTGDANRLELLTQAMQADEAIMTKSGGLTLDDNIDGDDSSVLELSSSSDSDSGDADSSDEGKGEKKKGGNARGRKDKGKKASEKDEKVKQSFIKAYRVNDPLELKPRQPRTSTTAATEAMSSIGNFFNPNAVRERDDTRMMQGFQITQLQTAQSEIRELRMRVDTLSDKLNAETRRADKAETQLELYQNFGMGSRRRHRSPSSPRRSTRRRSHYHSRSRSRSRSRPQQRSHSRDRSRPQRRSHSRARSPDRHKRDYHPSSPNTTSSHQASGIDSQGYIGDVSQSSFSYASSSRHMLNSNVGSLTMTVTPRRGRDGQVEGFEISPTRR